MATENTPQRTYRAACPGCGAPVEFRSATAAHAVCGWCKSIVVRDGDALARTGRMAELFDDHSPLQLLASGRIGTRAFTLVGRLQYRYSQGVWSEWHALLDDGTSAWLSEDNGAYVFSRPATLQREVPEATHLRPGMTTAVGGQPFTVASNETVSLVSAQGELPRLPQPGTAFAMVDLRNERGEVLSIDYGSVPPEVSLGRAVSLDALALRGLRDGSAREYKGRQFACPNCASPVDVHLAGSKSVTCSRCHSLIDVSAPDKGVGGELAYAQQEEPVKPAIPLGSTGQFQGKRWQVVGFQHRMGHDPQDADEHFGWEEYLLYNPQAGFLFLVDSQDGWSVVKPATGAPVMGQGAPATATYLGTRYTQRESYTAETTFVAGEFYWQVERGQRTHNMDFESGRNLLSREQAGSEITWSVGSRIDSETVTKAFGLESSRDLLKRADAAPFSAASQVGLGGLFMVVAVIVLLALLMSRCSSCDPQVENCSTSSGSGWRSSGGSYGGYSSGGGHK